MNFSIVTATYNADANLQHCFASIAAQTVPCERIVIDGGSRDKTLAILDENRAEIAHVVSEPDNGIYDALNKGIRMATGEVIGLLHADDFYPSPDILAKVTQVFADPEVEACYGDLVYVKERTCKSGAAPRAKSQDQSFILGASPLAQFRGHNTDFNVSGP